MTSVQNNSISKAVVVVPECLGIDVFHKNYGGETLLGRSLVVLSRSGISEIILVCTEGQIKSVKKNIRRVRHRLKCEYRIAELKSGTSLSATIHQAASSWTDAFLLLDCAQVIHPTLISQMTVIHETNPALFAFRGVWMDSGKTVFSPELKNKFRVIFQDLRLFHIIQTDKEKRNQIIHNRYSEKQTEFQVATANAVSDGFISTQIIICSTGHFEDMPEKYSIEEIIGNFSAKNNLTVRWIEPAWWLPVSHETAPKQIREFFWKIAFKEISGEFSKAVNSRLSKPMTFLFVRLRFTPNAISVIEIILFLAASAFLFIPGYWGMIVFALIWQLSAGVLDRCDGEVARMRNYESPAGARFDMLIDDLRFGIPLIALAYIVYAEQGGNLLYPAALAATLLWYLPAALYQQYYMRKAGYVSIQALGVDLLKSLEHEVAPDGFFNRYRFLLKGDIRTFYIFLLSLTGYKPVIFWVLAIYEWMVGLTNVITVQKMKRVMKNRIQ